MFGRKRRKFNVVPNYPNYAFKGFGAPVSQVDLVEMTRNSNYYFQHPHPKGDNFSTMNRNYQSYTPYGGQPTFQMYQDVNPLYPYNNGNQYLPSQGSYSSYAMPQGNKQVLTKEFIFQNPLEAEGAEYSGGGPIPANSINLNPYMHPYPKQSFTYKPPSGMKSIMNSFKTQEGNLDLNKMIDTAGQMANAVSQVQGMVKGLGGMFKV